jgi:hypothetical protein
VNSAAIRQLNGEILGILLSLALLTLPESLAVGLFLHQPGPILLKQGDLDEIDKY